MIYVGYSVLTILLVAIWKLPFGLTKLALIFLVLFNFVGVLAYTAGYRTLTFIDFNQNFATETTSRALLFTCVGALAFLLGSWAKTLARPVDADIDPRWLAGTAVAYTAFALVLPEANLFSIASHFGKLDAASLLVERLKTTPTMMTVIVDYSLTSIPALYALAMYLDKRCSLWWPLMLIPVAGVAKFATLQKEPFMVFLVQIAVLLYARRAFTTRNLAIGGAFGFLCLVGLYAFFQGGSAQLLAISAAERVFMRTAGPYCYVAQWVPSAIPYGSLNMLPTWASVFGGTYFPLSEILYQKSMVVRELGQGGTMSIPNIPWFYAAFGWFGVALGSLVSGAIVGLLDGAVIPRSGPARWAAIAVLAPIAFYLTETTIFGVLSGFGGAIAIVHVLLLSKTRSKVRIRSSSNYTGSLIPHA